MRCALVGFGQVAEKAHLPAFKERGIDVAAVAEANPNRIAAAKAALPNAKVFSTFDELLASGCAVDFVDVATPPFLHADQVTAVLRRGLDCLCEKPLALTPDQLESVRREAAASGKTVFTVHNWAYSPQWLKIWELLGAGAIGAPRHAELHVLRTQPAVSAVPGDWRREAAMAGGGILVDHGWHNFYLLYRALGERPTRVVARLQPPEAAAEDEATVFLEFPQATGLLRLSWRSTVRRNTSLIVGSEGVIEMADDEVILRTKSGSQRFRFETPLSAGSSHPDWFSSMLPDFEAERADPAKRGRNLDEASFCLSAIHRAYQGAREGRNPLRAALSSQGGTRR